MYLVDANIFLEVLLGQSKGARSKEVLRKFQDGKPKGIIPDFHVDSSVVVMENYKLTWKEIATFLLSLLKYEGVKVQFMTLSSKIRATSHMREYSLDFDDALAYQCMTENDITKIISYAQHFGRLENKMERIVPEELQEK